MAQKKKSKGGLISTNATVAENRQARFNYTLEERFEAGIALVGTEVKSLRHGHAAIAESHVGAKSGEIFIYNLNIPEYNQAGPKMQHDPKRIRKLLLKRREIHKLMGSINREGYTIVPLRIYFDAKGLAKIEIALAKGKKLHDKRETEKNRDWDRQKSRIMKNF
ncbi:MAG: SsrA-binding protein SmpB [Micavibrio sp.]|nr:SsrA-binding protein SmpB [Micavibrio sp.]